MTIPLGLADRSLAHSNGEGIRGYVEELCELVMYALSQQRSSGKSRLILTLNLQHPCPTHLHSLPIVGLKKRRSTPFGRPLLARYGLADRRP